MKEIEEAYREQSRCAINFTEHKSGYRELRYAPNKETARLYRDYLRKHGHLPEELRDIQKDIKGRIVSVKAAQQYNTIEFADLTYEN